MAEITLLLTQMLRIVAEYSYCKPTVFCRALAISIVNRKELVLGFALHYFTPSCLQCSHY